MSTSYTHASAATLPSFDVDAALASYGAAMQQLTPREPA
jgi:hypothetical protein